ncbi:L-seryl-tRNA(Sec) selenium transferase [candidate division LCP-89 bacterium B3_LCP]|uniref:L-seryl-tRNA(Sec) selenium transferase n=1 Tax=candidate division LCP-89 bacterium B3_LCP TaxID=2012998 RepID=A0A532UXR2_UNCL8|nr:MAG: L-seryl-tRNA(Sec) selenium transferase [candidate division LCP-89 bacterium B3_LCP]
MNKKQHEKLKFLPQVGSLLETQALQNLSIEYSHDLVKKCCNDVIKAAREAILDRGEDPPSLDEFVQSVQDRVAVFLKPRLKRVINATGIILHTGLGRAPLVEDIYQRAFDRVKAACSLELDMLTGKRGDRQCVLEDLITFLTGADAAAVVNNNAAAVMLSLNTLAYRKETIVSRGQLIEIGGSFRLPEIMRKSGTKLVEVGTTNRTYLEDYTEAITPKTRAVLVAHSSNYRVKGFVHEAEIEEIAPACRERGVFVIHDLGGGVLIDLEKSGLPHEPVVQESVKSGVHVATFSGDKVLGGPQCGILVGDSGTIGKICKNPMMRALRPDKFTLALLEETLRIYLEPDKFISRHPVLKRLSEDQSEAMRRAKQLYDLISQVELSEKVRILLTESTGQLGSGALPLHEFPSAALKIKVRGIPVSKLAAELRTAELPIIGYVRRDYLFLDVKAVMDEDIAETAHTISQILRIY